jgi:hypothetical protein
MTASGAQEHLSFDRELVRDTRAFEVSEGMGCVPPRWYREPAWRPIAPRATWVIPGDPLRLILNDWVANPVASNQAAIRSRFTVTYNSTHPNHLSAGSGIDRFFYKPPATSNRKLTDFLN